MIRVGDFGPKTPAVEVVRDEVPVRLKDSSTGRLQPFHAGADLDDSAGHLVIARGTPLGDPKILCMDWLVEGVRGRLTR